MDRVEQHHKMMVTLARNTAKYAQQRNICKQPTERIGNIVGTRMLPFSSTPSTGLSAVDGENDPDGSSAGTSSSTLLPENENESRMEANVDSSPIEPDVDEES